MTGESLAAAGGENPRLLHIATSKSDGGIERYSIRLAAALIRRGAPLWFVCRPESFVEDECRNSGVPTLPVRVRNSGDLVSVVRLARLIRTHRIDIVHAHSRRDFLPAMLAVRLARTLSGRTAPTLLLHVHLIRPLGEPAALNGKIFQRGADTVLAVSEATRQFLLQAHGFPPSFVQLLHNGIDLMEFALPGSPQAAAWRKELRTRWKIAEDALIAGMVGRLDAKGQEELLKIAPALIERFPMLHIVLAGSEGNAGVQERLTRMVQESGISNSVTFAGKQGEIAKVMAAFDILVHLPTDESFGLALAEAMGAGLPTVATDIGGCREVVRDKETGFLIAPGDQEGLTAALTRLLESDYGPMLRSRLGIAGRRIAEEEFSLDRQTDRLQELYRRVMTVRA